MFEAVAQKTLRNFAAGCFVVGLFTLGSSASDTEQNTRGVSHTEGPRDSADLGQDEVSDGVRLQSRAEIAGSAELAAGTLAMLAAIAMSGAQQRRTLDQYQQRLNTIFETGEA